VIDRGDVVLAFTVPPDGTVTASEVAGRKGKAMVVGTTGMTEAQLAAFKKNVAPVPCVFASNYTAGVTLLTRLIEEAARVLGDAYDVEVVEMHHHFKKDAPSGTALTLADAAARGLERNLNEVAVYGREGIVGARKREEIGLHAIRGGDIVGDHTVMLIGSGERIEFVHRVQSRDAFASGALRAVRFAVQARPGLYDMRDVLGIR
jgi:4-hydroxy-tetrahydrodipicolinate reductase